MDLYLVLRDFKILYSEILRVWYDYYVDLFFFLPQESTASWLDSAIPHISEIILLEDTPSIQIEVGVLVREFPDVR